MSLVEEQRDMYKDLAFERGAKIEEERKHSRDSKAAFVAEQMKAYATVFLVRKLEADLEAEMKKTKGSPSLHDEVGTQAGS